MITDEYIDRDNLIKDLCTVSAPTPSESWIVEKCIEKVNEQPIADVVPKSDVDEIIGAFDTWIYKHYNGDISDWDLYKLFAELKKKYTEGK